MHQHGRKQNTAIEEKESVTNSPVRNQVGALRICIKYTLWVTFMSKRQFLEYKIPKSGEKDSKVMLPASRLSFPKKKRNRKRL